MRCTECRCSVGHKMDCSRQALLPIRRTGLFAMQSERIEPPWPESVVDALNAYQRAGAMHPFTCGFDSAHVLVATGAGWVCPYDDYTQAWAHRFMTWPEARYSPPEPGRRA